MVEASREAVRTASILADDRLLPKRFLVVSNRLPYQLTLEQGRVRLERGVGGLVTALDPILCRTGGTWIGWTGHYEPLREPADAPLGKSYTLRPVNLSRDEVEEYYLGYSNKSLWPLFHYFQEYCEFDEEWWRTYQAVNRKFADAVIAEYREGDLIWVHDYHLMLVPALVRQALPGATIGFFLHIPFPGDETFVIEPRARELLDGMLGASLIGFQLQSYARNFMNAVAWLTDHRYDEDRMKIAVGGREVRIGSYPISIDFAQFAGMSAEDSTAARVERIRGGYRAEIVALGVDRLDYTKGTLHRLRAIERMLDKFPELQGKFTFVQISAPSRTKVDAYREMREKIEQMVGRINGRFGGRGCIPIDYRYESYDQEALVAYYRASDLALVTPLRDGMNLVAKEYVAARINDGGMLVLSCFAGAHRELVDAITVNPYDTESTAASIHEAIVMAPDEKRRRMRRMREVVRRNDIYWWLERFLRDLL
jgi:alpha,alpha-trehalose-phosphate synthase [UDP-forming]